MPNGLGILRFIFRLFKGSALVAGVTVVSASGLGGAERLHPSLVDPAITKCTVCHTNLGATHVGGASTEDCLSCHTMVNESERTILIVEGQQPAGMADLREPEKTGAGHIHQPENEVPVPPDTGAARPNVPRVETVAVIAGDRAPSSATDLPPTGNAEKPNAVIKSDGSASSDQLYVEGMAAFNRADFEHAFNTWRAMLDGKPDHYALQVEVDSLFVSAQSTFARYGDHSLFIIVKGDLYWVYSGLFTTREKAIEALNLLPEPLRQGGAFPITVREILPLQ